MRATTLEFTTISAIIYERVLGKVEAHSFIPKTYSNLSKSIVHEYFDKNAWDINPSILTPPKDDLSCLFLLNQTIVES